MLRIEIEGDAIVDCRFDLGHDRPDRLQLDSVVEQVLHDRHLREVALAEEGTSRPVNRLCNEVSSHPVVDLPRCEAKYLGCRIDTEGERVVADDDDVLCRG